MALPVANRTGKRVKVQNDHNLDPLICAEITQVLAANLKTLAVQRCKIYLLVAFLTVGNSHRRISGICILQLHTPLHNISAVIVLGIHIKQTLHSLIAVQL